MTFTSLGFVAFFLLVSVSYYLCPAKARWALLLLASCYFYMAFVPKYIFILFALIGIDFVFGQQIEKRSGKVQKLFLIGSILSNLGLLFVFKYFNFFDENISLLAQALHWNYSMAALRLILPLGLSFHTFQSLSYIIEVYRGKYKAERHLGYYALYVLFFPQLIAGPIERPQHLLEELKQRIFFDWNNVVSGLHLMGWGFFKKLVIADRLAASVDYVYGNIAHVPGLSIAITIVFFAFQLYADFSGYSDIARGAARVLGIDIVRNFYRPYFATSIPEFWRQWHISLSNWFRDYLYYPLVYSRRRITRSWLYLSLLMTFFIMGLWHGAGWTFIVMGGLYGVYMVMSLVTKPLRDAFVRWSGLIQAPRLHRILQQVFIFILVSFTWIFFRAPTLSIALQFIRQLFVGWNLTSEMLRSEYFFYPFMTLGFSRSELILSVCGIAVLLAVEFLQGKEALGILINRQPVLVRSSLYSGLVMALMVFGIYVSHQFIYFQF